ncbi:MAG: zinc finger domain-containing protein [Acutalibacteraceae bacterium]
MGPEPFSDLTAGYLADRLGKRRKAVKECLLEQSVIAGIGNIYADEILFAAQIGPSRAACSLTGAEWALQVYGKAGEPCPVCGEPLCRKVIGGRGSTYCPHCQREEKAD